MTDVEVEGKFRKLAAELLEPGQADRILAKLWDLDRLRDIGELIELLSVRNA